MSSLRRHEGYLLIDNSASPGVDDVFAKLPRKNPAVPLLVGEGKKFECPTITCSHCHRIVIINTLRERPRGYCRKCDHYICDWCTAEAHRTGECNPMKKVLDEQQEQAALREQAGLSAVTSLIIKP